MSPFRRTAFATALLSSGLIALPAQASEKELLERLDKMAREMDALKAEVQTLRSQQPAQTVSMSAPAAAAADTAPATVLTSYGEIHLNIPSERSQDTVLDVHRFIIGFQHRFNPKTKLVTELEVEHAVTSADGEGEVAVEQAYFERQISANLAARGGLMLMPLGFLNETHEPTTFFGVERNFVETIIIPSTLREAGAQAVYSFGEGYTLQGGVVTGPNLADWDFDSTAGANGPLRALRQEGSKAKARDPSFFAALNWRGIPGLHLGAAAIGGDATHGADGIADASYLLWDVHARYAPGRWQLSALYAAGSIDNSDKLNAPNVGATTLVPERFDGYLVETAYKLWRQDDLALWPFLRWEGFNTGRSYEDLGPGLTPADRETETVLTAGASLLFGDGLVLKADYQWFDVAEDADRLNLGMGWSF